jgi:hypothetical protein
MCQVHGTAGAQGGGELAAGEIVGAERRLVGSALDAAVDLAAGCVLLVEQHRIQAEFGGEHGRRHPGRPGADHGEVDFFRSHGGTCPSPASLREAPSPRHAGRGETTPARSLSPLAGRGSG